MQGDAEPLNRRLGHRVTRTAERALRRLVFDLCDRGRPAKLNVVLDVIIKRTRVEDIEDAFPQEEDG